MYNINSKIIIKTYNEEYELNSFNSINIYSDINTLTDTAEINIPVKNVTSGNKQITYFTKDKDYIISVGNKISIELTINSFKYDNVFKGVKQFVGYISAFKENDELITISCEDSMYVLKHATTKISFDKFYDKKNKIYPSIVTQSTPTNNGVYFEAEYVEKPDSLTKIKDIVDYVLDSAVKGATKIGLTNEDYQKIRWNVNYSDINSGRFFKDRDYTGSKIFEQMMDYYGIYFYFKNEVLTTSDKYYVGKISEKDVKPDIEDTYLTLPKLYVGLKYAFDINANTKREWKFCFPFDADDSSYKIIDLNDLEYHYFDKENELIVNYVSEQENTRTPLKASSVDGIEANIITTDADIKLASEDRNLRITKNLPNLSKKDIKKYASDNWKNYPDSGFKGSFLTFGEPYVRPGDTVEIIIDSSFSGDGKNVINETYYVDGVDIMCNSNQGFVQKIKLGSKL